MNRSRSSTKLLVENGRWGSEKTSLIWERGNEKRESLHRRTKGGKARVDDRIAGQNDQTEEGGTREGEGDSGLVDITAKGTYIPFLVGQKRTDGRPGPATRNGSILVSFVGQKVGLTRSYLHENGGKGPLSGGVRRRARKNGGGYRGNRADMGGKTCGGARYNLQRKRGVHGSRKNIQKDRELKPRSEPKRERREITHG